jgi:hypothetical protein
MAAALLIAQGLGSGIEDARCTLRAVHGWTQDQIELVDQSRAQKSTVGAAASLQQQPLHAEFAVMGS